MRPLQVMIFITVCIAILFTTHSSGFQPITDVDKTDEADTDKAIIVEKRQIEDLSDGDFTTQSDQMTEEEPGVWDRIVRAALKLFNKFIEWLNS